MVLTPRLPLSIILTAMTKFRPLQTLLLTALLCTSALAQEITLERTHPAVLHNGETLDLPWFGGLNAPQFQTADLDGDGLDDLLLFDRATDRFYAARHLEDGRYAPAPELAPVLPEVREWMMVRDYNLDGTPDLLTYGGDLDGIRVFRGTRGSDGLLSFTPVRIGGEDVLHFSFQSTRTNIFVSSIDYPAVADIDFDGDLDILTFNIVGGYMDYYQNMGVERGLGADTLVFELTDQCWGGFFESGLTPALDLAANAETCYTSLNGLRPAQSRHAGSTVLSLDYDGNGLMDIMLGDISFPDLILGLNEGGLDNAWIAEQDAGWNSNGVAARIPFFPAAFHIDVDGDGARDLVAAPSVTRNAADIDVGWYYRNEGTDATPDFNFVTSQFLVQDMIDVGSRSNVTSFDYDADGRLDLIVGNNAQYTGTNVLDSRLRVYRNVSDEELAFELVEEDYLGLSAFAASAWDFAPVFADMDGDGDEDAVIGERTGTLLYLENEAGPGAVPSFARPVFDWFGIDAGQFSKPTVADLDRDGLPDLLVGGFDGRIRFHRNVGTASEPSFTAATDAPGNVLQLGRIDTRAQGSSTGFPAPVVVQHPQYSLVFAGNSAGELEAYRYVPGQPLDEAFERVSEAVGGVDFGSLANPTLADFDGDGALELVVGNERGGLEFFRTNLNEDGTVPVRTPLARGVKVNVYPNPTNGWTTLSGWRAGAFERLEVYDAAGRLVASQALDRATSFGGGDPNVSQVQWDGGGAAPGVYLATLVGPVGKVTTRVIVSKGAGF